MKMLLIFMASALLLISSCQENITDSCETEKINFSGTFQEVQANVFTPYCISCHGETVQNGGLNLSAGKAYGNLVNADAKGASLKRVVPGNSDDSYLMRRLRGTQDALMPPSGKLSDQLLNLVQRWIELGAKNN